MTFAAITGLTGQPDPALPIVIPNPRSIDSCGRPDSNRSSATSDASAPVVRQGSPHGGPFAYRSCETDVVGWACERAAGARMPELLSDVIWSRLGAEHDADISVDRAA